MENVEYYYVFEEPISHLSYEEIDLVMRFAKNKRAVAVNEIDKLKEGISEEEKNYISQTLGESLGLQYHAKTGNRSLVPIRYAFKNTQRDETMARAFGEDVVTTNNRINYLKQRGSFGLLAELDEARFHHYYYEGCIDEESAALKQLMRCPEESTDVLKEKKVEAISKEKRLEFEIDSLTRGLSKIENIEKLKNDLTYRITQMQFVLENDVRQTKTKSQGQPQDLGSLISCHNELNVNQKPQNWFSFKFSDNSLLRNYRPAIHTSRFYQADLTPTYIVVSDAIIESPFTVTDPRNTTNVIKNLHGAGDLKEVKSPILKVVLKNNDKNSAIFLQAKWTVTVDHPNGYELSITELASNSVKEFTELKLDTKEPSEKLRAAAISYLEKSFDSDIISYKKAPYPEKSYKQCYGIPELRNKLISGVLM